MSVLFLAYGRWSTYFDVTIACTLYGTSPSTADEVPLDAVRGNGPGVHTPEVAWSINTAAMCTTDH